MVYITILLTEKNYLFSKIVFVFKNIYLHFVFLKHFIILINHTTDALFESQIYFRDFMNLQF